MSRALYSKVSPGQFVSAVCGIFFIAAIDVFAPSLLLRFGLPDFLHAALWYGLVGAGGGFGIYEIAIRRRG